MKGADIVNRLKEVLGQYTDDFSDILAVSSLTKSGTIITASTATAHNLITGDYITIRGAKNPITITSITRVDDVVTVITDSDHQLSDPSLFSPKEANSLTIEISGATPSEYNGVFNLVTVPSSTTFTFKITSTPATPATVNGFLLNYDFDGYNGYKQITVTNSTSFTYESSSTILNSPAQGNIELSNASRIAWSATPQRADQFYSEDKNRQLQNWLFVVMGPNIVYKDDTVASDLSSAKDTNESYFYESQNDFSLYLFLPSQDQTLGAFSSDKARTLEMPILKSIANYQFPSVLVDQLYQPTIYVGNEAEDYNTAYYVHRYDFLAKGYIQSDDAVDCDPGVALRLVDGSTSGIDLTYKPNLR